MKWYVFDKYDCFGEFSTVAEAAKQAEWMAQEDLEGIHIVLLSEDQFFEYCNTGKFPFSK